ncbi:cytochrome P450 family protein [Streptomyces sp. PA5.6]|uniref:cytochrome P450 family protein n=1 Tax=Streptomyces sp. PA5.6 TaxID=3035651 RepID=UPI003904CFE4
MADIVDLGAYGEDFTADPYPYYAALRARGPVHRVRLPDGREAWLVVGHDAARAALADPRLAKDWRATGMWEVREEQAPLSSNMLELDPPHHTRLRKLVAREFTAHRIEALRPRVQQITDGLLDAMLAAPDNRADLVEAFAFPLPLIVICELLGVPDMDRAEFRGWSNEMVAPTGQEAAQAAVRAMAGYLDGLIESKRREPGDDLLSALVHTADGSGHGDGSRDGSGGGGPGPDRLSRQELIGMAALLLVAGHETTVNLIANGMRALLDHPDQLAALRADFGLLEGAVEEMLRYDGPVEAATWRFTDGPVDIAGTVVPDRQFVLISLASADRDPGRFPAPDRFDITRDARGHVVFGHGIHYCLGAPLARLEGRIAVRALLERCPGLALDPDAGALSWRTGMLVRGPRRLPVRWD